MIVVDLILLDRFRSAPRCEHCHRQTPAGCHPAHISARGRGKRVDIACNLVSLCPACHHRQHASNRNPSLDDLWRIAAAREGLTVEDCIEKVRIIQRM